jgi:internalin A
MPAPKFESKKAEAAYRTAEERITKAARENATFLDLGSLGVTTVPPEIGQLDSLTILQVDNNQLTSVPPEIGQLASLTMLSLTNNQLTSVPPEIGQLESLNALYLNNNRLRTLPEELCQLSNLDVLFLHGNPQLRLPVSVLGVDVDHWDYEYESGPKPGPILDYYFSTVRADERQPLNEAKLILVGRGEAGKTSLVKRLVENRFSRREDTTQGIRIQQWPITVGPKKDAVRLNVWDFGGQEIMHATHQFFLTDRSLYLLVLDGRAGRQEEDADYWLRLISGFAPESPVLVVLNKIKKDHFTLNRDALQQKYPQVQGFLETDCDNPGPARKDTASTIFARPSSNTSTNCPTCAWRFPKAGLLSKRSCRKVRRPVGSRRCDGKTF